MALKLNDQPIEWLFEVAVSNSVAEEIVNAADRLQVDLIAMYTYDRHGLAKIMKGSVAKKSRDHPQVRSGPSHPESWGQ